MVDSSATRKVWEKLRMATGEAILGTILVEAASIEVLVEGIRDAEMAALTRARRMGFLQEGAAC